MTINCISDLHCRKHRRPEDLPQDKIHWFGFETSQLEPADVLVVAGDLGESYSYPFIKEELEQLPQFKHVICIRGNHDYWGIGYGKKLPKENDVKVIDNVAFICTPLWTPIPMSADEHPMYNDIMWYVHDCMNDFRYISGWTLDVQNEQYHANLDFIKKSMEDAKAAGQKTVIVTHSVPRKDLIDEKYQDSLLNWAFHVMDGSCDDIKPDLWLCGHAHNYDNRELYGVRYVRNPIGYRWGMQELPSDHWYNTVLEV